MFSIYFILKLKKGNYLEVAFPVYVKTAHDAAQIVLKRPKVKKHLPLIKSMI